jgi:glutathione S-transferase
MSLADLLIAAQLDLLAQTPEWVRLTADAPNLVAWLERMNERPSMKATTWERAAEMAHAA